MSKSIEELTRNRREAYEKVQALKQNDPNDELWTAITAYEQVSCELDKAREQS